MDAVTKRMVDIDDDLLDRARAVTGAPTIRATVDEALRRVVNDEAVRRHVDWLRTTASLDHAALANIRAPRIAEGA